MHDLLKCIIKYVKTTQDDKFVWHSKELARRIQSGIKDGYKNGTGEPGIVEAMVSNINQTGPLISAIGGITLSTNSIFIHGSKSYVEFDYYGSKTTRELGDIVFVLSVVHNGRKYFEKMTLNQVKKDKGGVWNLSSKSSKEQLYLLTRFPTFKWATNSLIPPKEYELSDHSGCLGTYGLLYAPGDFGAIGSKGLETILSTKGRLKLKDLLSHERAIRIWHSPWWPFPFFDSELGHEFVHLLSDYPELVGLYLDSQHFFGLPILGCSCVATDSYEFSDKYLRGQIGEMIYAEGQPYNRQASQFLHDLMTGIKKRAGLANQKEIISFVESFYRYPYVGRDVPNGDIESGHGGGGIGIIHTAIDLGEGE